MEFVPIQEQGEQPHRRTEDKQRKGWTARMGII